MGLFAPDYYTTSNYYPVVYMHDGQNLFDAVYAPFGEWNVDSTMEQLFTQFSPSAIIVAIDHGGNYRLDEYAPWVNTQYGGGQGVLYANFIANTLKPFIDGMFRTMPNRENTAIAGSSMGGLISFYTALQYPTVFSKAAIFSPSFWFSDSLLVYTDGVTYTQPQRFYFLAGQNESTDMVTDIQTITSKLLTQGFAPSDINTVIKQDGQHSEWFWKREFGDAFSWLFQVVTDVEQNEHTQEYINFNTHSKWLTVTNNDMDFILNIYDAALRKILESNKNSINLSQLKKGVYFVVLNTNSKTYSKKIIIF